MTDETDAQAGCPPEASLLATEQAESACAEGAPAKAEPARAASRSETCQEARVGELGAQAVELANPGETPDRPGVALPCPSGGTESAAPAEPAAPAEASGASEASETSGARAAPHRGEPAPCRVRDVVASRWQAQDEAVVGLQHRARNLPCQDAALAAVAPRPFVLIADGAGSAAVSELGARAVVTGVGRLIRTLDRLLGDCLDRSEGCGGAMQPHWPFLFVKHALGLLEDVAQEHRRAVKDVRCTLLCAIVGLEQILWFKVGDGEIVFEETDFDEAGRCQRSCRRLGRSGKAEFSNETVFLDGAGPQDVQWGLEPAARITGLAAMSDGAAERLVSLDGSRIAARLGTLLAELRAERLKRPALTRLFYEPEFCERTSGDDRSLALLAREIRPAEVLGTCSAPPSSGEDAAMLPAEVPAAVGTQPDDPAAPAVCPKPLPDMPPAASETEAPKDAATRLGARAPAVRKKWRRRKS